jgi:hypothetical protein
VLLLKVVVEANGTLSAKQLTIELPEKQVNTKVFFTPSSQEECLNCYCLYQRQNSPAVISCKSFKIFTEKFELKEVGMITDIIEYVLF